MTNIVISDNIELRCFYERLIELQPEFISVDTEFISSNRYKYFPKLCLIQIGYGDSAVIVDVLSHGIDLSIIEKIFLDKNITKVFHDLKQDILALLGIFKYIPRPVMDTQMMAMLCNYHDHNLSYAELVYSLLGVNLLKSYTRTDWLKRPLSKQQIEYAFSDVTFLCDAYKKLSAELKRLNRWEWIKEDLRIMTDNLAIPYSTKYELPNEIRKVLCEYRKTKKLLHDISDVQIYRLANVTNYTKHIFGTVVKSEFVDEIYSVVEEYQQKPCYQDNKAIIHTLRLLLEQYCVKNNLSYQSVSSTAEINRLVGNDLTNIRILSGWRYQEIGRKILSVLSGKLGFSMKVAQGEVQISYQ